MKSRTIRELKAHYQKKELSPVEVTNSYLERINQYKDLNAYITVCADQALKQAEISEKKFLANDVTGILEGIPLSYKDNLYTKGIRTTSGSKIEENFIPETDAGAVHTLQREGAINLGKASLHEYAFGITSNNPFYGPVRNPWNKAYTPGGSSGGSGAAVAASLCMASIGTDTGGSIRIPAASCGIVGLKPTYNLVDATGVTNISWSLDHVGPLTRNVDDLAMMMEALTGLSYSDYLQEDIRGLRVGVPVHYFNEHIDKEILALYQEALNHLASLGAVLIEIDVPFTANDLALVSVLAISEAGFVHENSLNTAIDQFGVDVRAAVEASRTFSALDYIKALKRKAEITEQFEKLFQQIDVMASPTLPATAQKIGVEEFEIDGRREPTFDAMIRYPSVFNLTGQPALSLPIGLTKNGLPAGLQLAAASFNEKLLIRAGYAYEQAFLQEFYQTREALEESIIN
ncbi:amidase [Bacillus sp. FJAT-27231]|uniref:Asp-tRNA(Asn)/Glu-tRNA(Gln) amidotransferase GatCAB subunit A n=1 Tax=Bacillus sp. FJAT-27231 TaxID=1679168 RepID=UPI00067139F1|nr:Asp-tRNA(Asn)/Glu-tRNA(Gln) amidotransferase GatCAB subunit A [Bacillus sp. FJAT-27231]KMY55261.1 amidase [Bacillus sp. FJAT-27231]